ncbi:hypothetical protein A9R16_014095 [Acidiferrobacter thiooxydans]|nr:hypothetical protein [Acidiferrobacter thiooxydans]UEN99534.1 hypothetical protein A9R16_014095 [Acidiferrobacter thiooxydans]
MVWERKAQEVGRRLVAIERDHAPAVFANSLGLEDMVLTDLIMQHAPGSACLRSIPAACPRRPIV